MKTFTSVVVFVIAVLVCSPVSGFERSLMPHEKAAMEMYYLSTLRSAGLTPGDLETYSIGQSHIDAAWKWRVHQTREKCIKTFGAAIRHIEEYPDFLYTQSSPQYYEWVMEDDPELFDKILEYERQGRWEIVGGQWVEPDNVMPGGESFCRQRLIGMRFYKEHFGHMPEISWLLDSFGYQWNLPQILKKSGAKYFWTNKMSWNEQTVFPFHLFHWQAPDGSRVLAYQIKQAWYPFNFPHTEFSKYYHTRYLMPEGSPEVVFDYAWDYGDLEREASGEWMNVVGVFYGMGDGGHGPINEEIQIQRHFQKKGYTRLTTAKELFAALEQYSDRAPVWNDELYLETHRGCLTTQGWVKRANRKAEERMRTAEVLQSIASRMGLDYAYEKLLEIWKLVLLNQFHDILPGSSIPEVYADTREDYDEIFGEIDEVIESGKRHVAGRVDTRAADPSLMPLVVFNTLSWERTGIVEIESPGALSVVDGEGRAVPAQTGECSDRAGECLLFLATGVPAIGYRTYFLGTSKGNAGSGPGIEQTDENIVMDNGIVSASVDKRTGWLTSVISRETGREFISGYGNQLLAWRDNDGEQPAWDIAKDYLDHPLEMPDADEVSVTAEGPLFVEVTARRKFRDSSIDQVVRLYRGMDRIYLTTRFDFHESYTLIKAGFDTTVAADKVAAETSYAVIERAARPDTPAQKAMWEAPCHRWIDISDGGGGLALLNNGKYGYSLNDDGTGYRLSLIKGARYPESAAEAYDVEKAWLPYVSRTLATWYRQTDQGEHTAWTALMPHRGGWREARVWQAGCEFNTPLEVARENQHPGQLPSRKSFLSVDNQDVFIGALKRAEDGDGLVLRLVEAVGKAGAVRVSFSGMGNISAAIETDILELGPRALDSSGQSLTVNLTPFEIKTLKLSLD